MRLETKRLFLRTLHSEDVPALVALWMHPDATRFMGGPREREMLEQAFAQDLGSETPPTHDLWPLIERETGRIVGHCGLLDKEIDGVTETELVYVIDPACWGRGYATEIAHALVSYAASTLRLPRLVALIDPANAASAAVARKVGMAPERDVTRPGGKRMHVYALAL